MHGEQVAAIPRHTWERLVEALEDVPDQDVSEDQVLIGFARQELTRGDRVHHRIIVGLVVRTICVLMTSSDGDGVGVFEASPPVSGEMVVTGLLRAEDD